MRKISPQKPVSLDTVPGVIDALGGATKFAKIIGKGTSTASEMKRSRSIPVVYWPKIVEVAPGLGYPQLDSNLLMRVHAAERAA